VRRKRRFPFDGSTRSADGPDPIGQGFYRVVATFGFVETPNVPAALERAREAGVKAVPAKTSYFLGRERLLPRGASPMARWRKRVFVLMSHNARSATEIFGLSWNRVVELGAQSEF
jgi:KUP system potassium uptake protein